MHPKPHLLLSYTCCDHHLPHVRLSQAAGLTFGLEQAQDVVLANWRNTVSRSASGYRGQGQSGSIPGPLTFRMMDRVWSSMNSTRTWVTPPREPAKRQSANFVRRSNNATPQRLSSSPQTCLAKRARRSASIPRSTSTNESVSGYRTGSAENAGHLDQLDGGFGRIHCVM